MDVNTHSGATDFCHSWGGQLLSIQDETENEHVYKMLNNAEDYWLGLSKSSNQWYWQDGTDYFY